MHRALQLTPEERLKDLYRILRSRVRHIPDKVLIQSIRQLNMRRLYVIKCTDSQLKFQNIATSETIATPSKKVLSHVSVLYGDYTPGHFIKTASNKTHISGTNKLSGPVIALKRSVYDVGQGISKTYTLIIFDCSN